MKLLFWTDGFWPRIGGVETQGLQFVEAMQKRGHECTVLAQRDPLMKEDDSYRGIPIKRFDFDAVLKTRELKEMHSIREYLSLAEFRPDILYLNTLANGSAFAFLLFRSLMRMPIVATIHAPYYDRLPPLAEKICTEIDCIAAASKWGYLEMQRLLPKMQDTLRLIPYGISAPALIPASLCFSPPTILLLGRLSLEKGFDTGVEAFALLKKSGIDARLIIAGEGAERPFLEHLVHKLSLKDSVQFTGGLDRGGDAVFSTINRATLVAMPSHFEAFGLSALEALRMGRPVIASDVGGLPEIVSHGETGLLIPPKEPAALYRAMRDLLEQPEKTIEMGKRARKWAMRSYLLEENVDRYEELFHECLAK